MERMCSFEDCSETFSWEESRSTMNSRVDLNNALLVSTNNNPSSSLADETFYDTEGAPKRVDVGTQTDEIIANEKRCEYCFCLLMDRTDSTCMFSLPEVIKPGECFKHKIASDTTKQTEVSKDATRSSEGETSWNTRDENDETFKDVPLKDLLKRMFDKVLRKPIARRAKKSEVHTFDSDSSVSSFSYNEQLEKSKYREEFEESNNIILSLRSPLLVTNGEQDSPDYFAGKVFEGKLVTILEATDESASNPQIHESLDWSARCLGRLNHHEFKHKCNVSDELMTNNNNNSNNNNNNNNNQTNVRGNDVYDVSSSTEITNRESLERVRDNTEFTECDSRISLSRLEDSAGKNFSSTIDFNYTDMNTSSNKEEMYDKISVRTESATEQNIYIDYSTDIDFENKRTNGTVTSRFNDTINSVRHSHLIMSAEFTGTPVLKRIPIEEKKATPYRSKCSVKKRRSLSLPEENSADTNNSGCKSNESEEKPRTATPRNTKRIFLRKNHQSTSYSPLLSKMSYSPCVIRSPIKPVKYLKSLFTDIANKSKSSMKTPRKRNVKRSMVPSINIIPATPM